jgi:hypothetical protein
MDFRTLVYYCYKHPKLVPSAVTGFLARPKVFHALNSPRLKAVYPFLFQLARRAKRGFLPAPRYAVNR